MTLRSPSGVIPAKAGTYEHAVGPVVGGLRSWVPAFAGMTLFIALAACGRNEAPPNDPAEQAPKAEAPRPEGDVGAAERLVRERLGNPEGLAFADPVRTASEGVAIVCGRYTQAGASHRYIVVDGTDLFLEPRLQPGEMDRYFAEYCREATANRPSPVTPQEEGQ